MNRIAALALFPLATLMTLGLGGCPAPSGNGGGGNGASIYEFSLANDGQAITIAPGDQVRVTLSSNPFAALSWTIAQLDQNLVSFVQIETLSFGTPVDGTPITQRWIFRGVRAGTTKLQMLLLLTGQQQTVPVDTFELTITVANGG